MEELDSKNQNPFMFLGIIVFLLIGASLYDADYAYLDFTESMLFYKLPFVGLLSIVLFLPRLHPSRKELYCSFVILGYATTNSLLVTSDYYLSFLQSLLYYSIVFGHRKKDFYLLLLLTIPCMIVSILYGPSPVYIKEGLSLTGEAISTSLCFITLIIYSTAKIQKDRYERIRPTFTAGKKSKALVHELRHKLLLNQLQDKEPDLADIQNLVDQIDGVFESNFANMNYDKLNVLKQVKNELKIFKNNPVKINIDIDSKLEVLFPSALFSSLLSNLLRNAGEKISSQIEIDAKLDPDKTWLLVSIKNLFSEPTSKSGLPNSTNPLRSGTGLYLIRKILFFTNGDMEFSQDDRSYSALIKLPHLEM